MLLKMLYLSLSNDIAPAIPNRSLKNKARKDARYSGSLKYSIEGLGLVRSFFVRFAAF